LLPLRRYLKQYPFNGYTAPSFLLVQGNPCKGSK
jgi:hypothetical protein